MIHTIHLGKQNRSGLTPCAFNGEIILTTRQPIFACARLLLDADMAGEDDTIETRRDGMLSMSGRIGAVAKWTVSESNKGGLSLHKWTPFDRGDADGEETPATDS